MEEIISKEEFDKLRTIKGETRGTTIKNSADFILKEEGKEGLKKLEDTMAKLGYPIRYQGIKPTGFYPLSLLGITLVVIKSLFNYNEKKFQEMGEFRAKFSLLPKLFLRYFVSLDKAAQEISKMWKGTFTVGDMRVVELNKEKKYAILRIENYNLHPTQCQVMAGLFANMIKIVVRSETACEETKCPSRGDAYHEYILKW